MPKYAILLHGYGVQFLHEGRPLTGGVYCWKCVEADSEPAAISLATTLLCSDTLFQREVHNPPQYPPHFRAEAIQILDHDVDLEDGHSSCAFYIEVTDASMNNKSWIRGFTVPPSRSAPVVRRDPE